MPPATSILSATVDWLTRLPHAPPMRLVEEVVEIVPGERARCRRLTRESDWFFQGHFPGEPVVPAIALVELLAQAGGLAAASGVSQEEATRLRIAALGQFKFPAGAKPGAMLEATARVTAKHGGLWKIEGDVTADAVCVAIGSVTLAESRTCA
jgi:3-hydroxyacyl-[acyl-carrier-protein] dehydratase